MSQPERPHLIRTTRRRCRRRPGVRQRSVPSDRHFLFRDGTAWIAAAPGFTDLLIGPTGVGRTREEALAALSLNPQYTAGQAVRGRPLPTLADCDEIQHPFSHPLTAR
jgi:hypothetical protein